MAARAKTMRRSNCFAGHGLLLEAPSRGKEVMRQLLRSGQIPGVFLKENGLWGEAGLCVAMQSCPARPRLPRWPGDDALAGRWWCRPAARCPSVTSRFERLRVYFPQLAPLNPGQQSLTQMFKEKKSVQSCNAERPQPAGHGPGGGCGSATPGREGPRGAGPSSDPSRLSVPLADAAGGGPARGSPTTPGRPPQVLPQAAPGPGRAGFPRGTALPAADWLSGRCGRSAAKAGGAGRAAAKPPIGWKRSRGGAVSRRGGVSR